MFGVGLSAASMKWNDHIFAFHIEVNALLTSCRKEARKTSQDKQGKPVEKQARYQSQKFSCQHVDKYVQYVRYFDVMPVGIWKETQFKKTDTTLTLAVFLFNPWILPICSMYLLFFSVFAVKGEHQHLVSKFASSVGFKETPLGLVEEDAGTFWMRFVTWPCLDSRGLCIKWKRRSRSSQPSCSSFKMGQHIRKILILKVFIFFLVYTICSQRPWISKGVS